ncbi:putative monooxygenase [Xylaria cf. heliscus]|nr:putative monooxygenase [Xylaria cf. heliscus]
MPFRVIIVGAGLVGLTAAHAFLKAGIDFVILEKHDNPLSALGSTLALWPQTFRIFDQLGLLAAAQPILRHVNQCIVLSTGDARIIDKDDTMELLKKNIEVSEQGVTVLCDDGTSQEGSIVIGADGVRSRTRLVMRALGTGKQPDDLPEGQKSPYVSTYRLYLGSIPVLPGLLANTRYDGAGDGVATQIVTVTDKAWFGFYEKLKSPTSQHVRYNEEDKRAILRRWGHLHMAPGWKLRDVNNYIIGETMLINLEEGLVDKWFHDRIVLVGDAVRKLEPHIGIGYNAGVTDLVVLVNGLRRLLQVDESPSTRAFAELFATYQADRKTETQKISDLSMRMARVLAWPSFTYKILAKYALPYSPWQRIIIRYTVGPLISGTPVLEWLDERMLPASIIPWTTHLGSHANHNTTRKS